MRTSLQLSSPFYLRAGAVLCLASLLAACASAPESRSVVFVAPTGQVTLAQVPFHPQQAYQCGPASLAGVLNYYGDPVTPEQIAKAIVREDLGGATTLDMVLFARKRGHIAQWYSGDPQDLQRNLDAGSPLVVMIDLGWGPVSRNHFMVVVGYDAAGVLVNSGETRHQRMDWEGFLRQWGKAQHWTLRIEPPQAAATATSAAE